MVCPFVARRGRCGRGEFRSNRIGCRQAQTSRTIRRKAARVIRSNRMGPHAASRPLSLSEQADELEEKMMNELNDKIATKSALFNMADGNLDYIGGAELRARNPGKYFLIGADPRLPTLPEKPTLIDFFKHRFVSMNHLLQTATLALKAGHEEKVVLACLLHDIAVASFIRCDHGSWGAQLIEPYVVEGVSWGVRVHHALRFFSAESLGYKYPRIAVQYFRQAYNP